jgi:hypothetical protein
MKNKIHTTARLIFLGCLLTLQIFAQSGSKASQNMPEPFKFDFIKDYRIKLDGGCSYYTHDISRP